ncbi:MAG: excalibur calcium-binding domain-containing protein [Rhodocyclaceae bacterium]
MTQLYCKSHGGHGKIMQKLIVLAIFGVLVLQGGKYWEAGGHQAAAAVEVAERAEAPRSRPRPLDPPPQSESRKRFRCDGRQYCSQMHSCEEATFFLRNCPGVKMDGNHDGVPCEKQWCN